MDPRTPEASLPRIKELIAQYERVENDIKKATTSTQLNQLEREGSLVVREIYLFSPRLHESMIKVSRQRRNDIAKGVLVEPQDTAVELPIPPNQAETEIAAIKPRKKKVKRNKK